MEMTTLGRTGVQVSRLCFGAMTLGRLGQHGRGQLHPHRPARARREASTFIDTADVYGAGDSGVDPWARRWPASATTSSWRRRLNPPFKRGFNRSGNSRALDLQPGRRQPTAAGGRTGSTSTSCTAPARRCGHRRERRGAERSRARGQDPLLRHIDLPERTRSSRPSGPRRGAHSSGPPRAGALQPPRARHRGGRAPRHAALRHGRDRVEPALRGLAHRSLPQGPRACRPRTGRRSCRSLDMSMPANQAKLEAVERLAQLAESAGLTMLQLALGFIREHPGLTAAIIGPRTLDQLEAYLGASGVQLDAATLDRIDEIVPSGHRLHERGRRLGAAVAARPGGAPRRGSRSRPRGSRLERVSCCRFPGFPSS